MSRPASSPPRRVLMTADCVGGVWHHALTLAGGLGDHGVDVGLVVFGGRLSPAQQRDAAAIPNLQCVTSERKLEWMPEPWADVDAAIDLVRRQADDFQPDILHLNSYSLAAGPATRAPVVVGAHSCVLSWWRAVKREPAPDSYDEYRDRVAAGLTAADCVVAPTQAMLADLRLDYDAPFRGTVIPNGINAAGLVPSSSKQPFILSAGRVWDEAKNIALLDRVASALPWPVKVAGTLVEPGRHGAGAFRAVQLLGPLAAAATREEMRRAAIYAAPALYEPFGLAILEAACAGCALVLADIPSLRELWDGAALFLDPHRAGAWQRGLEGLIADAPGRTALAARARTRARRFLRPAMAQRFQALYDDLLRAPALTNASSESTATLAA